LTRDADSSSADTNFFPESREGSEGAGRQSNAGSLSRAGALSGEAESGLGHI
jgi:hypothetical protein